jgi:hypothetical protein
VGILTSTQSHSVGKIINFLMLQQLVHAGLQAVQMYLIKTDFEISGSINLARVKGMNILKRSFSFR